MPPPLYNVTCEPSGFQKRYTYLGSAADRVAQLRVGRLSPSNLAEFTRIKAEVVDHFRQDNPSPYDQDGVRVVPEWP